MRLDEEVLMDFFREYISVSVSAVSYVRNVILNVDLKLYAINLLST